MKTKITGRQLINLLMEFQHMNKEEQDKVIRGFMLQYNYCPICENDRR